MKYEETIHHLTSLGERGSKRITIPKNISRELAYLVGVLSGDGNIFVRKEKGDYRIKCVGNPKDEKKFYDIVLSKLFENLFNLSINNKSQDSGKTYGFYIYSKLLIEYFSRVFDLPIGPKKGKLKIPKIIRDEELVVPFIRGVADTDFCITFKKKEIYPCISASSDSKDFIKEISLELKRLGFAFYEVYNYRQEDNRFRSGYSLINRIEINGKKNLEKWMKYIGFWNPKHLRKIKAWQETTP